MTRYCRKDAFTQLTIGLFLIALGLSFLLDQYAVFDFSHAFNMFWPVLLIAIGVSKMMKRAALRSGDREDAR